MRRTTSQLRDDALAIWNAALAAVDSGRLVRQALHVSGQTLLVGDLRLPLDQIGRIAIVGAGKAGAGMAAAVEQILGPELLAAKDVTGWVNVPADCVRPLDRIHLHAARPAGRNEPMLQGVEGADAILRLVGQLGPTDLCLCLLSGGASALLPAPSEGIALADKLAVTRFLSEAGANIAELNTVRKHLSRIKGGGLMRACRAGRLVALIISDVLGDPLDVIGSGPTVADTTTAADALAVLERFDALAAGIAPTVFEHLRRQGSQPPAPPSVQVANLVIGNNAVAVDAAGAEAERRGYRHAMMVQQALEGPAEEVGRHLAEMAVRMRDQPGPDCLISGGEPVVRLVDAAQRGQGGRNQQLVLAAVEYLEAAGQDGVLLLSGGTDGEDGPTDAAGALVDDDVLAATRQRGIEPSHYLRRNDAYHFFAATGGLIKTGPTHTNVCDVRIVLVDRIELPPS